MPRGFFMPGYRWPQRRAWTAAITPKPRAVAALPLPNMLQFALAGAVGVVASFLAARLVLRLPGAKSIL